MMAQAAHFNRYAVEPVPYGSWRFTSECRRLHHALNEQLVRFIFPKLVHDEHNTLHVTNLNPRFPGHQSIRCR
jgi:hypothetical protein